MAWIGVDVGGTKTQAVLTGTDLLPLVVRSVPTPAAQGGPAMLAAARDLVRELVQVSAEPVRGVGVGAAGVLDPTSGTILRASDSFTDWEGTDVAGRLSELVGLPAVADNDVNCFLLGELAGGAVRGARDAIGITLGTGVGGALWSDGRLVHGRGGGAGELGHLPGHGDELCTCGQRGHLETLASGRSLLRRYLARCPDPTTPVTSAADVGAAADRGDPIALELLAAAGAALGTTIVLATRTLDSAEVVVGGGVSGAWRHLEPGVRTALAEQPPLFGPPPRVHLAALDGAAVAVGAAALASRAAARPTGPA